MDVLDRNIEQIITDNFNQTNEFGTRYEEFADTISFSELVDKLTIVNIKLFKLKDAVANSQDVMFKANAAMDDIALCKERSRLKRCLDMKIQRLIETKEKDNVEVKSYG